MLQKYQRKNCDVSAHQITEEDFAAAHPSDSHIPGVFYYPMSKHVAVTNFAGSQYGNIGDWILVQRNGGIHILSDYDFRRWYKPHEWT